MQGVLQAFPRILMMPLIHGDRGKNILATVVIATVLVGGASLGPGLFPTGGGTGQPACDGDGYPDADCTGVPPSVTLTAYTGPTTITTAGTVIDGKNITSCITVEAPNVTIRNSRIDCTGASLIWSGSTNLLVEDVDLICSVGPGQTAVTPQNYTARRIDARGCENIMWAESNVTIEDSYIHDPVPHDTPGCPLEPTPNCHTDGIQAATTNVTIDHNRIYGGYIGGGDFGNSAITLGEGADASNIIINDNVLAGGGYTLYCNQPDSGPTTFVTNNRFSTIYTPSVGGFGPHLECEDEPNFTGNVYHETGLPV